MLKKSKSFKLGKELVDRGWAPAEKIASALDIQRASGERLGQILLREGLLTEKLLLQTLADQWGVQLIDPSDFEVSRSVLDKMPAKFAHHYHVYPLEVNRNILHLAVSSQSDFEAVQELGTLLGVEIKISFAEHQKIAKAIEQNYGLGASVVERLVEGRKAQSQPVSGALDQLVESMEMTAGEGSIRELVNMLILDAKQKRASDIHLEPFQNEVTLRYRIDGVLQETAVPEAIRQFHGGMMTRIKIMANLDISERRLPQDGRVKIRIKDEEIDLRISILPTAFGEALVIRILSPARLLHLEGIGFSDENLKLLRDLISRPHGIVLLTGPTGSGKTTTLYAALGEINTAQYKIITVEDPVEYQMKGIIQMQVHPKIGLSFASGLRHMLRHDPDIMMIGEIRDSETAEIAIRSALTGHLVFSTLHTNDAAGAVARLTDLGMPPYLVSSSLNAVIAQRLVRMLCPDCKQPVSAQRAGLPDAAQERFGQGAFYEARGCESCRGTGYQGRTGIHEIMVLDEELRERLTRQISGAELRQILRDNKMVSLQTDGFAKASKGITSIREVLRVVR